MYFNLKLKTKTTVPFLLIENTVARKGGNSLL